MELLQGFQGREAPHPQPKIKKIIILAGTRANRIADVENLKPKGSLDWRGGSRAGNVTMLSNKKKYIVNGNSGIKAQVRLSSYLPV